MAIHTLGVFFLSFLFFVIVSEQLNPFTKPEQYMKRSQWQLGRRFGVGALVCGFVLLSIGNLLIR